MTLTAKDKLLSAASSPLTVDAWDLMTWRGDPDLTSLGHKISGVTDTTRIFAVDGGAKLYIVDQTQNQLHYCTCTTSYDPTTATVITSTSLSGSFNSSRVFAIHGSGTRIYWINPSNNRLHTQALGTTWDPSSKTGSENYIELDDAGGFNSLATHDKGGTNNNGSNKVRSIHFNSSGTKLFVHWRVNQYQAWTDAYSLSNAWDVTSTLTLLGNQSDSFAVADFYQSYGANWWGDSGNKFYNANTSTIRQYDVSSPYDFSEIPDSYTTSVSKVANGPRNCTKLNPNGDGIFYITSNGRIVKHTLSPSWDLSSFNPTPDAGEINITTVLGGSPTVTDFDFKPDGTIFFVLHYGSGSGATQVSQFNLSTAWDLSTASNVANQNVNSNYTLCINPYNGRTMHNHSWGGTEYYTLNSAWQLSSGVTYKGNAGLSSPFYLLETEQMQYLSSDKLAMQSLYGGGYFKVDITARNDGVITNFQGSLQNNTSGVETAVASSFDGYNSFFTDNGYKYYWTRYANIKGGSLTTAYDLSTLNQTVNFQITVPSSSSIRPETLAWYENPTKLWRGTLNEGVFSYNPSTNYNSGNSNLGTQQYQEQSTWDLATVDAVSNPSSNYAFNMEFGNNGYYIYYAPRYSYGYIFRETLSTAYDLSSRQNGSITYTNQFLQRPIGIFLSSTGSWVFGTEENGAAVTRHYLSSQWQVNTMQSPTTFNLNSTYSNNSRGIDFKPDGSKMYLCNDTYLVQYTPNTSFNPTGTPSPDHAITLPNSEFYSIKLKDDGTKIYALTNGYGGRIYQWAMSTAYDLSTATLDGFYNASWANTNSALYAFDISGDGETVSFMYPNGYFISANYPETP